MKLFLWKQSQTQLQNTWGYTNMDTNQYLEIFIDETKEHIQTLNDQLLIIENEPENKDCINEIFRAAHSLKGMAGTMGFKRMQRLTHDMENVFSEIRNDKMKVTAGLVDVLFQSLDAIEGYLENIMETTDEGTDDNEPIIQELNKILKEGLGETDDSAPASVAQPAAAPVSGEIVEKYSQIKVDDSEKTVFEEAKHKGMNIYGITVYIQDTCILKAARAFLVFKALEEIGEIMSSTPSVQDIEDEKFNFDFSLYLITSKSLDKVLEIIKSVSEIQTAIGESYDDIVARKGVEAEETKEVKTTPEPAVKEQETAPVKATENKPAAAKQNKPAATKGVTKVGNRTVRVDIEKLDSLMNQVSELIIAKNSLVSISQNATEAGETISGFHDQIEYLERITTNLHESVMKVRMVPIESVVNKFPRMIRDLQKKLGKEMNLYMTGEDTELDRSVIDEIGDPLMHLLRNSADHGLEANDVRAQRGKPEVGSIFLDAYQDGNNVVIEVRDDGNGIDIDVVRNKAIERGIVTPEQGATMSDKDIIDLLFLPSFSTAKKISDVSGRGVGLDVVKSKIEALGGDVEVKSTLGEGSSWIVRLPLTLAIIQALMVEVGTEKYAISLGSIVTIEDVPVEDIKYVESREVIHLRGLVIPIIRMKEVLDIEEEEDSESMVVVIVKKGDKQVGLVVDNLIGQQEIVIKSLGKYISSNKIISGATILGDGEVALIIDVNTLL